jgi:hypothetical protein
MQRSNPTTQSRKQGTSLGMRFFELFMDKSEGSAAANSLCAHPSTDNERLSVSLLHIDNPRITLDQQTS